MKFEIIYTDPLWQSRSIVPCRLAVEAGGRHCKETKGNWGIMNMLIILMVKEIKIFIQALKIVYLNICFK